jgi:hypothetical protein
MVVLSLPLRGMFALKVNGVLRTETARFLNQDWTANAPAIVKYRICSIEEKLMGLMKIIPDNGVLDCSNQNNYYQVECVNPPIKFKSPEKSTTQVYNRGEVMLLPVKSSVNHDSFFLQSRTKGVKCTGAKAAGKSFMGVPDKEGVVQFYLEDPRMRMIENTVESPSEVDPQTDGNGGTCPVVAKTFINTGSCARRDEGTCAPLTYASGQNIKLNAKTLKAWCVVVVFWLEA